MYSDCNPKLQLSWMVSNNITTNILALLIINTFCLSAPLGIMRRKLIFPTHICCNCMLCVYVCVLEKMFNKYG